MKKALLALLLFVSYFASGQSLGKERVERLRQSVVNVYIDTQAVGTAFFVTNDGWLLTSWRAISPALVTDDKSIHIQKKISIQFSDGERLAIGGFASVILDKDLVNAVGYDYCLMKTEKAPRKTINPLRIGTFEQAEDGDEIYACGFPLNTKQQFISKGIISTKFKEEFRTRLANGDTTLIRDAAWLDITMTKGSSGGPVIKMGRTPEEDLVIGIANVIQSPYTKSTDALYGLSQSKGADLPAAGDGQYIPAALINSSYGLSGCISIDYFNSFVEKYLRK